MPSEAIKLLTSDPALVAYTIVSLVFLLKALNKKVDSTVKELKGLHKEAMEKIDKVNDSLVAVAQISAVHARELEIGEERFKALEKDVKSLRDIVMMGSH